MTTLKWSYWIHPGTSWFESFCQDFLSPDIRIWPEDSEGVPAWFGWSSHHLDDVSSRQELVDRTSALKAIFDGALYIARGAAYNPISLTNLNAEEGANKDWLRGPPLEEDVRVSPFSQDRIAARVDRSENPLNDFVATMIFLARYDEMTCSILKYTGVQGLSYFTLYAYRDWMNGAKWDDKRIAAEAGWSNAKFDDFTNTANNPAYLGPYSRHGGMKKLPTRPMPLAEAQGPMRKALGGFLTERANSSNIKEIWQKISL